MITSCGSGRAHSVCVFVCGVLTSPPTELRFAVCLQDDQTPLHISSRLGKQDIVQQLLANGAYPDATTGSGYTPLHLAAREGHRDVAVALLEHGADLGSITKVLDTDSLVFLHLPLHTRLVSNAVSVPSQLFCTTCLSGAREHYAYFCHFPAAHKRPILCSWGAFG